MTNEAPTVNYRELLEQERRELADELLELGVGGTGLEYDSNFADTSQVTAERGETEALVRKLRAALDDVEHALERVADGTYGVCTRCGEPIGAARLEAKPAVTTCIACASQQR